MSDMRFRRPTNITLDPAVMADLDAWIETQPIKVGRSAVIETAIKQFLAAQTAREKRRG